MAANEVTWSHGLPSRRVSGNHGSGQEASLMSQIESVRMPPNNSSMEDAMCTLFMRGIALVTFCFLLESASTAATSTPPSTPPSRVLVKDDTSRAEATAEPSPKGSPGSSTEIRWFFPGRVPAEVQGWFSKQSRLGDPIKEGENRKRACEERPDLYLIASEAPHLGVKLREGKLEIKLLIESKPQKSSSNKPLGNAETWRKWGWKYAKDLRQDKAEREFDDRVAAAFISKTPEEQRLEVLKKRCQRKFEFSPSGPPKPVSPGAKVAAGIAAEVTELKVADKDWWTMAIEVVGEVREPFGALQDSVLWLLEDYPGPALDVTSSYSYPHWVAHEVPIN